MSKRYCIICGKEIQSDDPDVVFCPEHGGSSIAEPPARQPQETIWEIEEKSAQPLTDIAGAWQSGQTLLDTYVVVGKLGEGGMGLVYRVHHKSWNMDLAVKQPKATLFATQKGKEDFIREAETWVDLGLHPHITSCYYVRTISEIPHIFVEFMEGGSLEDWIQRKRYDLYASGPEVSLERILGIAIQFAWGLAYAHEQGLVHQDVKPLNVLMTPDGVVKVTDFGLAKARARAGESIGKKDRRALVSGSLHTVAYRSPEQARGEMLSHKTDIWSWGVSVLEMFEGGVYWYDGQSAGTSLDSFLGRKGEGDLPIMPEGLNGLLRQCFKTDPNDRPEDMQEIANKLIRIYRSKIGEPFSRKRPEPAELRADSLNNKALSLLDLGMLAEAEELLQQAYVLDKANPYAAFNLSHFLWGMGKIDDLEVLSRLEGLLKSHPDRGTSVYLLGLTYLRHGDVELALKTFSECKDKSEVLPLLEQGQQNLPGAGKVKALKGHASYVNAVTFSPDGRYLLSGSWDKTLKLWESKHGSCLRTFNGHEDYVKAVCFHPDGNRILSFSEDDTLRLWDTESGKCLRVIHTDKTYGHHDKSVIFSPDGRYAISFGGESFFCLWDTHEWTCLRKFRNKSNKSIESIAFCPDGNHILTGRNDGDINLWEVRTGDCLNTFKGHQGYLSNVLAIAFSPDGSCAISGGYDHMLRLWDVNTWDCILELQGHQHKVNGVDFSSDGKFAISISLDHTMRVWDVHKGACLRTFETGSEGVLSVAYSPKGQYAVSAGEDSQLHLWNVQAIGQWEAPFTLAVPLSSSRATTQKEIFTAKIKDAFQALNRGEIVIALRLAREARNIPGYEREESALKLWSLLSQYCRPGKLRNVWRTKTFKGHDWVVSTVAFSPNQRQIISGSWDKTLRLWDVDRGECLKTFQDGGTYIWSAEFSPDGRTVVSASGDIVYDYPADCFLRLWDIQTGDCRKIIRGHQGSVNDVSFSPDGRFLLSASDMLRLWDVRTGQCLRTFTGHANTVNTVVFSPDGCHALSAGAWENAFRLWDLATAECIRLFEGHQGEIHALTFSKDGTYILSGGHDSDMRLWGVETGKCLKTLTGHEGWINTIALSPDMSYALSGSYDKTLQLWDMCTGKCIHIIDKSIENITSVAISLDGKLAVTGSGDKTVKLFFIDRELDDYNPADWDEGAKPYLDTFLTLHTPYRGQLPKDHEPMEEEIQLALIREGKPTWTETDFQQLLNELRYCGYGWLRPEGVRQKLKEMAKERGGSD